MDASELIDTMVEGLEQVLDKEEVEIFKKSYLSNQDFFQEYLDTFYPPEDQLEEKAAEFVDRVAPTASEMYKESLREAFIENYYGGKSLASKLGIDERSLNTAYTLGYQAYNQGNYSVAKDFFSLLSFWDDKDPNFRFGYGATLHMMKDYESAIQEYIACGNIDPQNPIPWFHMIDCCIQLERYQLGKVAAKATLLRVKDRKEFIEIKKKTEVLLDAIMQKIEAKEAASTVEKTKQ